MQLTRLFPIVLMMAMLFANSANAWPRKHANRAAKSHTITGCLQKGDEPDEFSITGEDGKTYGLRSSTVVLSKHLGHKVTVTGNLKAESYEKEKGESEEHEKKEAVEAGDIRVTNLKMVSDTCK